MDYHYRNLMQAESIHADRCVICGRRYPLNQHHIVPRSAGNLFDEDGNKLPKPTITLCGIGNHATVDCTGSRKAGTVGEVAWFPCGRYYSASTIPHALVYAADCEVRNMDEDAVYEIRDVLEAYRRIVDGFTGSILRCLSVPQRRD